MMKYWPGNWEEKSDPDAPHEAGMLNLSIDKAYNLLGWKPNWNFEQTIKETMNWYRNAIDSEYTNTAIREFTQSQINRYSSTITY